MRTVRNDHKRSKWIHWINGCSGCPMITFICVWTATAARSSSSSSYRHTATPVRLFFFSFLLDAIDKLRSSQTPLSPNFTYLVLHRLHQNFSLKKKKKLTKVNVAIYFLINLLFKYSNELMNEESCWTWWPGRWQRPIRWHLIAKTMGT